MTRRPPSSRARSATGAPGRPEGRSAHGGPTSSADRARATAAARPGGAGLPGRARILSARSLVLGITLLVGFTIVFPTVRAYLGQQALLGSLSAQVSTAEQQEKDLQAELDRWGTDAFVVAQARERLGYVMPGETAYRVIDPETVAEPPAVQSTDPAATSGAALPVGGSVAPWYTTIWASVQLAGASEVTPPADDATADPAGGASAEAGEAAAP